ncbi:TrbC/VirB2 family protein [Thermus caldilimi]|uniref:TrbC/VirB2 family protein n=1 Tax=Thermus caldilimi TaxID=2483360 RepID=UPI0010769CBE|nr:TrbC/VirB2 family protein [Thermus caldilimi]
MWLKDWLRVFRLSPGMAVGVLMAMGTQLALAGGGGGSNPLAGPMNRIQGIICGVVDAVTGPFGAALAIIMLALGFGGLIIGNRNSMGLIITAIAGGALLLAAKALGNAILGATGCA